MEVLRGALTGLRITVPTDFLVRITFGRDFISEKVVVRVRSENRSDGDRRASSRKVVEDELTKLKESIAVSEELNVKQMVAGKFAEPA